MSTKVATKQDGRQPLKKLISEAEKIEERVQGCEKSCDTARKWAGDARGKVAVCEDRLDAEHLVLTQQDKQIAGLQELAKALQNAIETLIAQAINLESYTAQSPWQHMWAWAKKIAGCK